MKFKIFESNKEIDLERLIDTRALICSNSGGGKSYTARKILEETSGKVMSIIFDVDGELKTLREKYDFLLVGNPEEGADVEINLRAADILPKKIMELGIPIILDLSDYSWRDRIQYVKKFLKALLTLPRSLWKTCIVFLDEAHKFCGQQEKQDSTYEVIDLMGLGRKRGLCGILATQRIAKLHKDAVAECNNVFVGRTWMDIDQKRAGDILGFSNKKEILALRDLNDGEFWVFGPAIGRDVEKEQVSKSKTVHPKRGMDLSDYISKPTDKIKSIMAKISDLPKEAEKELKEKKDYLNKIQELKKELRISQNAQAKPLIKVDEKGLERAYARGVKETEIHYQGERKKDERYTMELEKMLKKIGDVLGAKQVFKKPIETRNNFKSKYSFQPKTIVKPNSVTVSNTHSKILNEIPVHSEIQNDPYDSEEINLGPCPKKIYSFLYNHSERSFSRSHVGAFTGYSVKSGGFKNAISKLNSLGLITKTGNLLQVKEMDPNLAGEFDFSKEAIMRNLGPCPTKIYQLLLDNPYEDFSRDEIADDTGYSIESGGFKNAISKLNSLGLIIKEGSNIKLNPELLEI